MNMFARRRFAVLGFVFSACVHVASMAQPAGFSAAGIADPAARAAAGEAIQKAAGVSEYYCSMEQTTALSGGKAIWNKFQFAFRRPNLAFEQLSVQQTPIPGMSGQQQWTVCDGGTIWEFIQNAPGSENELLQRFQSKLAPAEVQKIVQRHRTPQASRKDAARLEAAGIGLYQVINSAVIHDPWAMLEPAGVKLESQGENFWTFSGNPATPSASLTSVLIVLNKSDGLARKIEFGGASTTTLTVSTLQANPPQKVEDRYFASPIPAGVEAPDKTDTWIESFKSQQPK